MKEKLLQFTNFLVTSPDMDTYSAIGTALFFLKGPKHGGASIKVCQMFNDRRRTYWIRTTLMK
jgi:citrate synthase